MTIISKLVCEKCGKDCPIDKSKTNKNWVVYKINNVCECGHCGYVPVFKNNKKDK